MKTFYWAVEVRSVQVLHGILRGVDHFMKVVIHVSAGVLYWTESRTDPSYRFLVAEKQELQTLILEKTNIMWDIPDPCGQGGNTTTGNVARRLLLDEQNREIICSRIQSETMKNMLLRL